MSQLQGSQYNRAPLADKATGHWVDMGCLAILVRVRVTAVCGVLQLPDPVRLQLRSGAVPVLRVAAAQGQPSPQNGTVALTQVAAGVAVLIIVDIIFAFTEIRVWVSEDPGNPVWQTLRPMHNFGIFCYALIMLLKVLSGPCLDYSAVFGRQGSYATQQCLECACGPLSWFGLICIELFCYHQ